MKYDGEMLDQICDNIDLFDYISSSIELKKSGDIYFGSCPKHIDKTPSLSVNPRKNRFECYSCGREGRIIDFLVQYENLSFDEAVEKAAKLANIDLASMCQSETITFLKKVRTLQNNRNEPPYEHPIVDWRNYDRHSEEDIVEWMEEGISEETMKLFGIRADKECNRIVYPVFDLAGNLINIKGRTRYKNYKELRLQKYINYYKVGCMDYFQCLNYTLPFIKEKNEVIIFESIKSVMKIFDWGYKNSVSAEKHTLTPEQINLLVKLKVDVVFAYDSDVDYRENKVRENLSRLKRITNVFIIEDKDNLLGGAEVKNSPADCGREVWEELYQSKRKVV